ncbi:MAG: helicase-exonuclease AddAB subunit AddA [Lachnospiraceae bacterium]|nr:helicase-exonuclease AddAB subunit AddA [Lachnospiraceae bacterium]
MGKVKYTEEQQAVIDARRANLLVSAAAGSGKTAVLTQRIVSLINDPEDPADIDSMLIVTFTKAAAAEMRERIGNAIASEMEKDPDNMHLAKQETLLHNAQITTIDSFCLFVVKNHFSAIDLDPGFRAMDEAERTLLKEDVLEEILEEEYARQDEAFINLIESYEVKGNEGNVEKMIFSLFEAANSEPFPEKWLNKALEENECSCVADIKSSRWFAELLRAADRDIITGLDQVKKATELARLEGGPRRYLPVLQGLKGLLEAMLEAADYDEKRRIYGTYEKQKLSSAGARGEDKDLAKKAKEYLDSARKLVDGLGDRFSVTDDELMDSYKVSEDNTAELIRLVLCFIERFSKKKREKNVIDFADMDHFALQILLEEKEGEMVPTPAALEYRDHFKYIFVDEYQDSNLVQEYIIKSIAREDNYFMVGDVKQSIYRFRHAKPEIFIGKYESFSDAGRDRRIDLNKNFRSRDTVLDFVNDVFERIMYKEFAEIDYDDRAKLYKGADYPEDTDGAYKSELLHLALEKGRLSSRRRRTGNEETPETENSAGQDEDVILAEGKAEYESLLVGIKILELMRQGFKVKDKESGEMRPLEFRDIVILERSRTNEDVIKKIFDYLGIPLYYGSRTGYFSATEIKMVMNALQTLDNPRQDIPLYSTVTSFKAMLSDEEMALLKGWSREKGGHFCLFDILSAAAEADISLSENSVIVGISEKCAAFLEWLDRYRDMARFVSIRVLLDRLLAESNYIAGITAMPDGDQRRANISMLLERATEFERTSYYGLFHFVRYISRLKEKEVDYGEAGILDENANVVRLMTIHKSKGLEFPVVFVVNLRKKINQKDSAGPCLVDSELGVALKAIDPVKRISRKGLKYMSFAAKMERDAVAEELRVLYVALTRAKEKLIITDVEELNEDGSAKDICRPEEAKNCMDMIRYVINMTDVSVKNYEIGLSEKDLAVSIVERGDEAIEEARELLMSDIEPDPELSALLDKKSEYRYAFPSLQGLFTKTTVSELKKAAYDDELENHMFEEKEPDTYIPSFAGGEGTDAAGRGTAYHKIMELLPFEELADGSVADEIVKETLDNAVLDNKMTDSAAKTVRISDIVQFAGQDIAIEMSEAARSGKLYKEQPFFYAVPARRFDEGFPEEESVLVQGVIDAYFEKDGVLTLLDYKTDRVSSAEQLVDRYKIQLEIYAEALEQISGKKVGRRAIYSFALNKVILL